MSEPNCIPEVDYHIWQWKAEPGDTADSFPPAGTLCVCHERVSTGFGDAAFAAPVTMQAGTGYCPVCVRFLDDPPHTKAIPCEEVAYG